jgi:hypothetical protein
MHICSALREHDPWARDGVVSNHYFAHGDTNPKLGPDIVLNRIVELPIFGLERDRGADRIRRPTKLGDQRIAA